MTNTNKTIWHWYHNVSECYYHLQITIKYRRAVLNEKVQEAIKDSLSGIKERYEIEISHIGFDQNHIHILLRFIPTYSGSQVVKVIKSISGRMVFEKAPEVKKELWGGEFWSDGYYLATVRGKGDRKIIENYIINQGRGGDVKQLKLFDIWARA